MNIRRWKARGLLASGCLLALGTLQACYDKEDPCGAELELAPDGLRCICPAGSTDVGDGQCLSCAPDELATSTGCVCPEGQVKNDQGICAVPEVGAPCTTSLECNAPYDYCEPNGGYCTSLGCSDAAPCPLDYACMEVLSSSGSGGDSSVAQMYCRRPPIGAGQSCAGPEDCAGTEATFCDYFKTCSVEGCNLDRDDCFQGFECCDLTAFGVPKPLCIAAGYCAQ